MIVVLRRNARHLASKWGRGERPKHSSRVSKVLAEREIGADSTSSSLPYHWRAGSLPPFAEGQVDNKEVLHVSSAEEPPSPMDATRTLPFHVTHLAW